MSSAISPLLSSPSTANFSIFSSAESCLSRSTPSPGASRNYKRTRDVHEIKISQKRRKLIGRPKNGWTPSRRRKLVRLYLMTNLEVDDISKVLRADGFKPCKRDIQNQLTDLLQPRPNQIRAKGHITQERLRLLRECKSTRLLQCTDKSRHHNRKPRNRQTTLEKDSIVNLPHELTGVNSETSFSNPEHTDFWSWLDLCLEGHQISDSLSLESSESLKTQPSPPSFDASLTYLDRPEARKPSLEQDHFMGTFDSHKSSFFSEADGIALFKSRPDAFLYDTTEESLPQGLDSPTISGLPLLDLPPPIPQKSSLRPTVASNPNGCDLPGLDNPSASCTSHLSAMEGLGSYESEKSMSQYHANPSVVNTNLIAADQGIDTPCQPLLRTRSARPSALNVTNLRKRLSQGSNKHSSSTLEDIISLMEHFTISTSSAASTVPSKAASSTHLPILEEDVPLPNKIEYPVVLPGAFPEYCWEQINNNNLRRCNKGQKYRKASLICRHTGPYSPSRILNPKFTQYQVYEDPNGERVDIFGNTALHIAATLATPPNFLIDLVKSAVNIHTLNNGGQTFLHLIHPESRGFCRAPEDGPDESDFANDICTLLTELKKRDFYFRQQDYHGRTSLHWLTQPGIPQHVLLRISTTLRHLRIKLPTSRDNLGLTITGQMKHFGMLDPDEEQEHDRTLRVINSTVYENGHIRNYTKNAVIETIDDLQRYEFHTDLLRTMIEGQKSPRFENWNGQNGLHCLAEVSFDLHLSNGRSSPIPPFEPYSGSAVKREVYLENLLSSGVDPNSYDKDGTTPLMAFIINTRAGEDEASTTRILTKLFTAGADIHRRNRQGETALHIAVKLGRKPATKFLLNVGANVQARTHDGLGVLALGHKYANKSGRDESLYAQIMLCISLVVNARAVSAPSILQEWGFVKKGYIPRDTASPLYRDNNFFDYD